MSKLVTALMQEIVRLKLSGASKLHIQLLQQKIDKLVRHASDTQATDRKASSSDS